MFGRRRTLIFFIIIKGENTITMILDMTANKCKQIKANGILVKSRLLDFTRITSCENYENQHETRIDKNCGQCVSHHLMETPGVFVPSQLLEERQMVQSAS